MVSSSQSKTLLELKGLYHRIRSNKQGLDNVDLQVIWDKTSKEITNNSKYKRIRMQVDPLISQQYLQFLPSQKVKIDTIF